MLIIISRTRLFLAFIQQRTLLGGAPTLRLQVQPMNFTLISHHAFQYKIIIIKKLMKVKLKAIINYFYQDKFGVYLVDNLNYISASGYNYEKKYKTRRFHGR